MKKYIHRGILLGLALCSMQGFAEQSLDRIVAVINNGVIVESELNETMNKIKTQMAASNTSLPPAEALRKQVLEQLVIKRLQLQLADVAGLEITDEQVDKAILSIAKKNRLTVAELYQELAKRGMDKKDYRKDIHDEYLIHQIQEKAIAPTISISTQEVEDFMRSAAWQAHNNKEYHLEDILIALPDAPKTEDVMNAKKRAETLLTKLRSGGNFSEAAMTESGSTKALQGGDLGWRKLPEIPTAFASLILLAKEGEIVGPVQTPNGFHLIHIAGIRNSDNEPKGENQRQQVQQYLFERKFEEALQNWISKIRGEAFIDMNPKG
jgi:peptidyl-prolyl cis-trans isomerase SurA